MVNIYQLACTLAIFSTPKCFTNYGKLVCEYYVPYCFCRLPESLYGNESLWSIKRELETILSVGWWFILVFFFNFRMFNIFVNLFLARGQHHDPAGYRAPPRSTPVILRVLLIFWLCLPRTNFIISVIKNDLRLTLNCKRSPCFELLPLPNLA